MPDDEIFNQSINKSVSQSVSQYAFL